MSIEVLDPTYGEGANGFERAPRPDCLEGLVVGVISNGKKGTIPFFDALEAELKESFGVAEVVRVTKANYSAPAETTIVDRARTWNALISGVGD